MIHINESLKLARIKFKTRKVRNIFSSFTVSLGIAVILALFMSISGLTGLVNSMFQDKLQGKYYSLVNSDSPCLDSSSCTIESVKGNAKNAKYGIKNITEQKQAHNLSLKLSGVDFQLQTETPFSVDAMTLDNLFVEEYVYKDFSWDKTYDGAIPVIVPETYFLTEDMFQPNLSNKQKFEKRKQLVNSYIGKTFFLELGDSQLNGPVGSGEVFSRNFSSGIDYLNSSPYGTKVDYKKTDVKVIVVGVIPTIGGAVFPPLLYQMTNSFVFPKNLQSMPSTLSKILNTNVSSIYLYEFGSKQGRDDFVKDNRNSRNGYAEVLKSRIDNFEEGISILRNVGLGFGGFLLLVSSLFVLSTVGKIADDSRREIGVFRAFGAKKKDIKRILFSFTFLLTTVGYTIGFLLALLICVVISLIWGEDFFYSIANMSTSLNVSKPLFVFLGFPFLEMIGLFIFASLLGFVAAFLPVRKASNVDVIKALRTE
jgi:ABC-type antimicrobial peptide transport system permease subunit